VKKLFYLIIVLILSPVFKIKASIVLPAKIDTIRLIKEIDNADVELIENELSRPNPFKQFLKKKQSKNKKAVALLLAFPFPFGIVGLHRIYMGCAPYIPVAYIGSLGGVFGILPFIDFCVLLATKDLDEFSNSSKIFMWVE
jgi:TM2 domain-containing membrane protein YozV